MSTAAAREAGWFAGGWFNNSLSCFRSSHRGVIRRKTEERLELWSGRKYRVVTGASCSIVVELDLQERIYQSCRARLV